MSGWAAVALKVVAVVGIGFFLFHGLLGFGYGVDFVDSAREADRYFLGEGTRRAEVPRWLYNYHQLFLVFCVPAVVASVIAGILVRRSGDRAFERYVGAGIVGWIVSTLVWKLAAPSVAESSRVPGQVVLAGVLTVVGVGVVAYLRARDRPAGEAKE